MKSQKLKTEPVHFNYQKGYFVKDTLQYVLLALVPLFIFAMLKPPVEWLILFAVLFIVFLFVFGLSPLFTGHRLTQRRLIIRQGLYFRLALLLKDVESVYNIDAHGQVKRAKLGLRSEWGKPRLYVTSSLKNLILIKLRRPRYVPYALGIVGKVINEVVVNVVDIDKFIALMNERI